METITTSNETLTEIGYMFPRNSVVLPPKLVESALGYATSIKCECGLVSCQICQSDWYSREVLRDDFETAMAGASDEIQEQYMDEVWRDIDECGYLSQAKSSAKSLTFQSIDMMNDPLDNDKDRALSWIDALNIDQLKAEVFYREINDDGDEYIWRARTDSSKILYDILPRVIIQVLSNKVNSSSHLFKPDSVGAIKMLSESMNRYPNFH